MKVYLHNFFHDMDLTPFYRLFSYVFNTPVERGGLDDSEILFESVFGTTTLLSNKTWKYSFLFIGESDRRLPIFITDGVHNPQLKEYSCVLKGKTDEWSNVVNFPLFVLYIYSFKFKFSPYICSRIPPKNVCVIISNAYDDEGRTFFIDQLEKFVHIDYAGAYKNNVPRIEHSHSSPKFIEYLSNYKVIISMENSKNNNYITEKLINAFAANVIPVYWGADNVGDYFNEERFIHVKKFSLLDLSLIHI